MNKILSKCIQFFLITIFILGTSLTIAAEPKKDTDALQLPKNIISLVKANTFPNTAEGVEVIEPSNMTKELLSDSKIKIDNPELIKILNESVIKPSPIAIGYRAQVYLGRWPLHYNSENTSVIWDYQAINQNELNNIGGNSVQELRYLQQDEREVKGALTNKIDNPDMIKAMMLQKTKQKTNLPLSFSTKVGANTKLDNFYHVPMKKTGFLQAYVPAVNEKGQVTYGEVYIRLKGSTKMIEVKNVTKQGIGAWIPIQDHVALSFILK